MTSYGLAAKLGITEQQAQIRLGKFFGVFTGLAQWIRNQQQPREWVELASGRTIHLNPYDENWPKFACNYPIQGTASEMIKRALHFIHVKWPSEFGPFGVVEVTPDELGAIVPEECGPRAQEFVEACMNEASTSFTPDIPAKAEVIIGKSWADK